MSSGRSLGLLTPPLPSSSSSSSTQPPRENCHCHSVGPGTDERSPACSPRTRRIARKVSGDRSGAEVAAVTVMRKLSLPLSGIKMSFGFLVIGAGVCGLLSFALLATSLGTDYWYIIKMSPGNASDFEDMSSHSGLWTINEGGKMHAGSIDSFKADYCRYSETEVHMLNMHSAIVVVLPLSLVLLPFGGICALVSSLARSPVLLTSSASYFFICSLLTLCGVSLYIIYSFQALAETERLVGAEGLAQVHTSFGWSLGMAWLSYGLEVLTGVLLLMAAKKAKQQHSSPTMA